jgi:hypothetical protein
MHVSAITSSYVNTEFKCDMTVGVLIKKAVSVSQVVLETQW